MILFPLPAYPRCKGLKQWNQKTLMRNKINWQEVNKGYEDRVAPDFQVGRAFLYLLLVLESWILFRFEPLWKSCINGSAHVHTFPLTHTDAQVSVFLHSNTSTFTNRQTTEDLPVLSVSSCYQTGLEIYSTFNCIFNDSY